jgi:hypothetical protein
MTPVSPQSVNEMKRMMEILGGAPTPPVVDRQQVQESHRILNSLGTQPTNQELQSIDFEAPPTFEYDNADALNEAQLFAGMFDTSPVAHSPAAIPSVPVSGSETDHMREILKRFYESTNSSMARINERAETNPRLKEALATKKTPKGVQVGSWEISVHEDTPGTKTYDVVNVHTNEPIAHDLSLYESALGLTKLLNKNVGINNPRIHEILRLEDEFTRQRNDASTFKRKINRMIKEGDEFRAHIAEDRYNECKTQAISLRNQLIVICKSL